MGRITKDKTHIGLSAAGLRAREKCSNPEINVIERRRSAQICSPVTKRCRRDYGNGAPGRLQRNSCSREPFRVTRAELFESTEGRRCRSTDSLGAELSAKPELALLKRLLLRHEGA